MKFALISISLPPIADGQAMMLYRLLGGLDPADYCLISRNATGLRPADPAYAGRLPAPYYSLEDDFLTPDPLWLRRLKTPLRLLLMARQIARIVRRENCRVIVACTGYVFDLPAAYLASRLVGVPLYLYLFDDSIYKTVGLTRLLARCFEPVCLRGAARIVAINAFLDEQMRRRHPGLKTFIIHNPCDTSHPPPARFRPAGATPGAEIRLVFTGSVYEAHYDTFRHLIAALRLLPGWNLRIHLYTSQPEALLQAQGIAGPVVQHPYLPLAAVARIQQEADLLFLPLAFASPYPQLIKVSSPSKMGEYLATGRPVIVHAPPDAFISWYCRRHDCGAVIDQPDPIRLAAALRELLESPERQRALGANARRRAELDFDQTVGRKRFASLMGLSAALPLPADPCPVV